MSDAKRAIVIGVGFGGLALAIRLQAAGAQTTLLERRDKPGGRAYVYQEPGVHFRRRPHGHHRPDGDRGAVHGGRSVVGRLRRTAARGAVLPAVLGGRLTLRLRQ